MSFNYILMRVKSSLRVRHRTVFRGNLVYISIIDDNRDGLNSESKKKEAVL